MAHKIFLAVDADWNNTSNWTSGTVPVTGDSVFFPSGTQSVTTNMNQTAVNLIGLETDAGYSGTIGASGSPLRITCDKVFHRGSGSVYYDDEDNPVGGNTGVTDLIIVDAPANLSNAFTLTGDSITTLIVKAGHVTVGPVALGACIVLESRSRPVSRAIVDVTTGLGTEWTIHGGEVTFGTSASPTSPSRMILHGGKVSGVVVGMYGWTQYGGRCDVIDDDPALNAVINGGINLLGGTLDVTGFEGVVFGNSIAPAVDVNFTAVTGSQIIRRSNQSLTADVNLYIAEGVEQTDD